MASALDSILQYLPANVRAAALANEALALRSITPSASRASGLAIDMGGDDAGLGVLSGFDGQKTGNQFTRDIGSTFQGQALWDANNAGNARQPFDINTDFNDRKLWKPGAREAVLGSATFDDKLGLTVDPSVVQKFGLSPKATFMDRLVPALILAAAGMGAGQMFSAATSGSGFLPAGGAGGTTGGAGGAVAGGGGGGNVAGRVAGNSVGSIVPGGASVPTAIGAANPAILAETAAEAAFLDGLSGAAAGAHVNAGSPKSAVDTLRDLYQTVKPVKDVLSIGQTVGSLVQGANASANAKDAAANQERVAEEQLRQQQTALQEQLRVAQQAQLQQQAAQEAQLKAQQAAYAEQLRQTQAMAAYQQQVQAQQLAQQQANLRLQEEALRRNNQRQPDFASILDSNRRSGAQGQAGTMLTGAGGIDPLTLLLGRSTLLGA